VEINLAPASMGNPFQIMENDNGYDMMCPFSGNKIVLIHGTITTGEEEETAEERDDIVPVGGNDNTAVPTELEQFKPDLDNIADAEDIIYADTASLKYKAWLAVDSASPQKHQHKSTILLFYSSPLTVSHSVKGSPEMCLWLLSV
jgi:hypothetical protein